MSPESKSPPPEAATSTSLAKNAGFGERLKFARETNPAFILAATFAAGIAFMVAIYGFVSPPWKDHMIAERDAQIKNLIGETNSLRQDGATMPARMTSKPLAVPIRIALFGPFLDDNSSFGLSQVRGVLGGLIHGMVDECGLSPDDWKRFFIFAVHDTSYEGSENPEEHKARLMSEFDDEQKRAQVVFGPMLSQDAIDVLFGHTSSLSVPTILTTAASTKVRTHPQYGQLLFQLSPNLNEYSSQYMRYIAQFLLPKPGQLAILHRSDEYGRASEQSLARYAIENGLSFKEFEYPSRLPKQGLADYASTIEGPLANSLRSVGSRTDLMVLVADLDETLQSVLRIARKTLPSARFGTLTSLSSEQLLDPVFDDTYLIYSFAKEQFSLDTLAFYKYAGLAQIFANDVLPSRLRPSRWQEIETVDAEVHDATAYWLNTFVFPATPSLPSKQRTNLYVTNFLLRGGGPTVSNVGALFLFQVHDRRILPVPVHFQ